MTLQGSQLSFLVDIPSYPIQNPRPGDRFTTPSGTATVSRANTETKTVVMADYGSGIDQPHTPEPQPGDWIIGQTLSQKTIAGKFIRLSASGLYLAETGGYQNDGRPHRALLIPETCKRTERSPLDSSQVKDIRPSGWIVGKDGTMYNPLHFTTLPGPEQTTSPDPAPPEPARRHSPKGKASGWIEEREGNKHRPKPSTSYYYCWESKSERHKRYIPARLVQGIQILIENRRPVREILSTLPSREQ